MNEQPINIIEEKEQQKPDLRTNLEQSSKHEEEEDKDIVSETVNDFRTAINDVALEVLSYGMLDPTKRKPFAMELKKNKICQEYVDSQLYIKFLQTNNPHIKFSIVYRYLYIKQINSL